MTKFRMLCGVLIVLLLLTAPALCQAEESVFVVERGKRIELPSPEPGGRVVWTSADTRVASVSGRGVVTGRRAGQTSVSAVSANRTAEYVLLVTQPVTSVRLKTTRATLQRGETLMLEASVSPGDATDPSLSFSSADESIALVDENGLITAVKAGRTVITATAQSGKYARMYLTVTQPVTAVALSADSVTVARGQSVSLTASVEPPDATNRRVSWKSSDTRVARVSSSGRITGCRAGECVVSATASNGLVAVCRVTVTQPVTGVSLGRSRLSLARGGTLVLSAVVSPADATDRTLVWTSSNPAVATVSEDGAVRGLRDGECIVSATASNGKKASVRLRVTSVAVTGVSLDRRYVSAAVGQQIALNATVGPADATEKSIRFESSDPGVAAVDQSGLITALSAGQCVVRAVSADNGAIQAQCAVTVRETDEKRMEGLVIGINPGHQIKGSSVQDPIAPGSRQTRARIAVGTAGVKTRTPEYAVNLQVALKLRDLLIEEGATVVMTRTTNDARISNIERAQLLNGANVDIALQLHCNGSSVSSANGISVYTRSGGAYAGESAEAARALLECMLARTGANNAGAHRSGSYISLNWSSTPSVLIEMGYMSNPAEDVRLSTDAYQQLLACGMLDGLLFLFGR